MVASPCIFFDFFSFHPFPLALSPVAVVSETTPWFRLSHEVGGPGIVEYPTHSASHVVCLAASPRQLCQSASSTASTSMPNGPGRRTLAFLIRAAVRAVGRVLAGLTQSPSVV